MSMHRKTITVTPMTVDPNGIATSQTVAENAAFTLNGTLVSGGVATLNPPSHVTITPAGDESGTNYTVTGTDRLGITVTDVLAGANATVTEGTVSFATVTSVTVDDTTADTVEVGVAGAGYTGWIPWDRFSDERCIQVTLSSGADITWSLEHTNSDVFAAGFQEIDAAVSVDASFTAETESTITTLSLQPVASRFTWDEATTGTMTIRIQEGQ